MYASAIVPAHNEAATVAAVVAATIADVGEVLVVDSCSTDDTAAAASEAGAMVISVREPGKHRAIRAGIAAARGQNLVFLDADLIGPQPGIARRLLSGLGASEDTVMAKGYYVRSSSTDEFDGCRLTEICARPLLAIYYPNLSVVRQPLGGEYAVRADAIREVPLAPGYSVDLGMLIHCSSKGKIAEVNLGTKRHRHRRVLELGISAVEVAATILRSAGLTADSVRLVQYEDMRTYVADVDVAWLQQGFRESTLTKPGGRDA